MPILDGVDLDVPGCTADSTVWDCTLKTVRATAK